MTMGRGRQQGEAKGAQGGLVGSQMEIESNVISRMQIGSHKTSLMRML